MIVSNAQTADEFRAEMLEEIERRVGPLKAESARAKTQRARYAAGAASRELMFFAEFIRSIHFGKFPQS